MSQNYAVGEFVVEAFTLINQYNESLEITNMVMGFKLYESIFNKFVTGEVSVADGLNLPKNFRLTGQEYIRISIKQKEGNDEENQDTFSIDKTFRIYKLDNVIRVDEVTQSYVLRICDPRMFYARRKKISQTLRGRYDQILQNALIDVGKFKVEEFDAWEQTKPDNKQLICPNWSVAQLTDYIVNNSQVGENHAFKNDMFFYQTLNGGFRFQSFDSMCTQEFPIPFSNIPRNTSQNRRRKFKCTFRTKLCNTRVQKTSNVRHITSNCRWKVQASTLKVYDPIRKLEEENVYDLESSMKKGNHVSGHPMLYVDDLERVLTAGEVTEMTTSPEVSETDVDIQPTQEFGGVIINDYHNQHSFDNATSLSEPEVFESRKLNDSGVLERRF